MKSLFLFTILGLASILITTIMAAATDDPRESFTTYASIEPVVSSSEDENIDIQSGPVSTENLTVKFEGFDQNFVINLQLNKDLLSPNFYMSYIEDGKEVTIDPSEYTSKNCHYKGTVQGVEKSWAALSICDGISGAFNDGKETYYIEPDRITDASGKKNFLFRASDVKSQEGGHKCGVIDDEIMPDAIPIPEN